MSSITARERPGVYSVYDASSVLSGSSSSRRVAVAAAASSGTQGLCTLITSYESALELYGAATSVCPMTELIRLLFVNGATSIMTVPPAIGEEPAVTQYQEAFEKLSIEDGIRIVICGSASEEVQALLKTSVDSACQERRDRIAVVGADVNSAGELVSRAESLNYERMVLAAPNAVDKEGSEMSGIYVAAALAGRISAEGDPAIPIGGAVLKGLYGLAAKYGDGDIDTLIRGGVTPVEVSGGDISVVRGVTTKTKTGGASDSTWRELTTILIVDNVIPAIRDSLRAKFSRAKNTVQSRGAVRSQVIMELENKKNAEIIDDYGKVSVTQSEDDPTVCVVDFEFDVVHGLNQIHLYAHITV